METEYESLAGEAGARAAVSARKYITIPAAYFNPIGDGFHWYNNGDRIYLIADTNVVFAAPVVFPGSGPVSVKKVILYTYDNNDTEEISLNLYKSNPATDSEQLIASVQSFEHTAHTSGSFLGPTTTSRRTASR